MAITFGPEPGTAELRRALEYLDQGMRGDECKHVDFKEDPSRRGKHGEILDGEDRDARAAEFLAGEAACMANTPGGGIIIVGVNDKDDGPLLLGTRLDPEWLRERIYDLTSKALTVDVQEVHIRGVRLLVLRASSAIEPIRYKGKLRWRVNDKCVEIDATSWHARHRAALRFDWSAQASGDQWTEIRPAVLDIARSFLTASGEDAARKLADANPRAMLSRLNAIDGDGVLTNAAALLFIGRDAPCLDYIRRSAPGQDSSDRVRQGNRALLEQLQEVFTVAKANNPISHFTSGLVAGQVRQLPERAMREAIVNGIAHREWGLPDPTLVEHEGATFRVSSPGGFFGGVTEANIITHPSTSRNTALAELLAALRVAEREGIGVDRMIGDLLRRGLRTPTIREIAGPYVVTTMSGTNPDEAWMAWLIELDEPKLHEDLRMLMTLRILSDQLWVDEASLAPRIQTSFEEARDVLAELQSIAKAKGKPLLSTVAGVPAESTLVYVLSDEARQSLEDSYAARGVSRTLPDRATVAKVYARHRGRVSTTELASILGTQRQNMNAVLKQLMNDGDVRPSSEQHRGRGFHYLWNGSSG